MNRNTVVEFANTLSEEDLRFLVSRLSERLQGDVAEALDFMSHFKQIDNMLSSARTGDELLNLCDQMAEVLQRECKKKGLGSKS